MTLTKSVRALGAAVFAAATVVGCASDSLFSTSPIGATEVAESALNVVAVAPDVGAPEALEASFWAIRGKKSVGLLYRVDSTSDGPENGHGREVLRLTVDKKSLLARPDGTPFVDGDSVLITLRVVDASRLLFEFEPAGLTFSASDPAELRVKYDVADGDLDHNGHHDAADDSLEDHLAIWRQGKTNDPFTRLASFVTHSDQEVRADLPGFSRYAVSY